MEKIIAADGNNDEVRMNRQDIAMDALKKVGGGVAADTGIHRLHVLAGRSAEDAGQPARPAMPAFAAPPNFSITRAKRNDAETFLAAFLTPVFHQDWKLIHNYGAYVNGLDGIVNPAPI